MSRRIKVKNCHSPCHQVVFRNGSKLFHAFSPGLSIYREIRVFPRAVGNTGKYREIGNQWAHNYGWQALWLGVLTKSKYTEVSVHYCLYKQQPSTSIANFTLPQIHYGSDNIYILFGIPSEPQLLSLNMSPTCSMGLITSATAMLIMSSACLESWITSKAL